MEADQVQSRPGHQRSQPLHELQRRHQGLSLWGKNLGDKRYYTGGFDLPGLAVANAYINVPRTFGAEFRYRFW